MTTRKNIYFASDVHLVGTSLSGRASKRELLFTSWLNQIKDDAAAIFLLGDIFDFWIEYKSVIPRGFTRLLGKIAEIVDSDIPIHFFRGNHDFWISDYLSAEIGAIVHDKPYEVELMGKRFFLAHGDGLDGSSRSYKLLKWLLLSKIVKKSVYAMHPDLAFWLATAFSKYSRSCNHEEKSRLKHEKDEEQIQFVHKTLKAGNHFDYFVFGHRHIPLELDFEKKCKLFLLGDWLQKCTYGVFDGKAFSLKTFSINTSR